MIPGGPPPCIVPLERKLTTVIKLLVCENNFTYENLGNLSIDYALFLIHSIFSFFFFFFFFFRSRFEIFLFEKCWKEFFAIDFFLILLETDTIISTRNS